MHPTRTAYALASFMCLASIAVTLTPAIRAVERRAPTFQLEAVVPQEFGEWRVEPSQVMQVVNPQTQQLLDKLYGQVLARAYVNRQGYRVMLSLAYGTDQRASLQAHRPEVCYVAQGFSLLQNDLSEIPTSFGQIPGRRVSTQLGGRLEPITYWFTIGDQTVRSRLERRIAELKVSFTGEIPDGLLFRVSSIDPQPSHAYREHDQFVNDLLSAVSSDNRTRLSGLGATP